MSALNPEGLVIEAIALLEQAKQQIEKARAADRLNAAMGEVLDGRALSIAVTHLETAQLWVANARK